MKYLSLALLFLLARPESSYACSCAYVPTFCETISFNGGAIDSSYVIVHAKVESKNNDGMSIRILNILFGEPEGTVLHIPQGYGADCRESVDGFDKNSEYIFALLGYQGDYFLYICGVTWLNVSGNEAVGSIAPGVNRLKISEFTSLNNCGGIGSSLAFIEVTPTLTSTEFEISASQDIDDLSVRMYDMAGRLAYHAPARTLLAGSPLVISAGHFPPGCYAILTETAGFRRTFRVIIIS
jgi:hypothetical protein